MIDVLNEDLIDLRQACKLPVFRNTKTGKAAHIASLYRHVMRGAKDANGNRVRLQSIRTPSGLKTSHQAVVRFITALTDPDSPLPAPTSKTRAKQVADAERELVGAGFELGETT